LYTLSYSIIAIFVIIIAVWRVLPHTGLFKKIALGFQEKKETGFTSSHSRDTYLGKVGKTVTSLRPAGKANFAGCSLDVSSEGDFIEKDKEVVVVKVEGNKIIVREKAV
jgi:membrane-bound serine protease (ClpP class)